MRMTSSICGLRHGTHGNQGAVLDMDMSRFPPVRVVRVAVHVVCVSRHEGACVMHRHLRMYREHHRRHATVRAVVSVVMVGSIMHHRQLPTRATFSSPARRT